MTGELDIDPVALHRAGRVSDGSPEGAVTAPPGAMYLRLDGDADTTVYLKDSGTGAAGWVGVALTPERAETWRLMARQASSHAAEILGAEAEAYLREQH